MGWAVQHTVEPVLGSNRSLATIPL